jgi:ribosomal protein L37AE/L43A
MMIPIMITRVREACAIVNPDARRGKQMAFKEEDITYCAGCKCMTHSIRKGRAYWVCGKCGHDKTLGDIYQEEYTKEYAGDEKK